MISILGCELNVCSQGTGSILNLFLVALKMFSRIYCTSDVLAPSDAGRGGLGRFAISLPLVFPDSDSLRKVDRLPYRLTV